MAERVGRAAEPGEFRAPRAEEREAFTQLQRRGYASGEGSLAQAPPRAEGAPPGPADEEDDARRAYFVDGLPVAGACLRRYTTWWGEAEVPMEGVGGVVALPEARRRGYTARVMAGVVADMRARGVPIATITTPFSYAFYRRAGWEYAFWRLEAECSPRLLHGLGRLSAGTARFVRVDADGGDPPAALDRVYRQVVRSRYQGAAARSARLWREHLRGERTYAYVWERAGDPVGYVVVAFRRGGEVEVRELLATDRDALLGLAGLLADLDSQTERLRCDLPPDLRLDLEVAEQDDLALRWRPQGMLRIVDVAGALGARAFPGVEGRIGLRLQDALAPWNQGPFTVSWEAGRVEVRPSRGEARPDEEAALDQRTFAQLYAGTLTPAEAVRRGAEIGARAERVMAAALVTGRPPLLWEHF